MHSAPARPRHLFRLTRSFRPTRLAATSLAQAYELLLPSQPRPRATTSSLSAAERQFPLPQRQAVAS